MTTVDASVSAPSEEDGFVAGASEFIGGPLGSHAVRPPNRWGVVSAIVIALTCFVFVLHWAQKSDCSDGQWVKLSEYRHACYTDVVALYFQEGLVNGDVPYADHAVEYPVITGAFMGVVGLPVHAYAKAHPGTDEYSLFYNITAFLLGLAAIGIVIAILRMRRLRPWDAAMFAVAPVFFLTATINWDLLAALAAVFALYAWGRKMPVLAGILIGVGAATKLWPALLLVPLVLIAWRARRMGDALFAASIAVLTWFAVNLPVMMLYFGSWNQFFKMNYNRDIDWGTLWYIGQHVPVPGGHTGIPPFTSFGGSNIPVVDVLSYALFGLAIVGLALLTYIAPRRPRLAQMAFLTIAAFLIFSKVWSQQYALWLLPLAILARPRWGAFIAWQCAEICYFFAFDGELMRADGNPIFPESVFVLAASLRLITVIVLSLYIVWDVLHPERDVVLETYGDDPDGGVFVNAEDRWEVMAGLAPPSAPAAATR